MDLKIKKGFDLPIAGGVGANTDPVPVKATSVAIDPSDFTGFIAKVDVKPGDTVKAGSTLMHHKTDPDVRLVSPVSGSVKDVIRGERRKVLRIVIQPDDLDAAEIFSTGKSAEDTVRALATSGILAQMRQRPYDIIPSTETRPRDIFVTTFDSAPIAYTAEVGTDVVPVITAGVSLLSRLTDGNIYISRRKGSSFPDIEGAVMVDVEGPHPAGLAGIQAANIKPVNKGETIWTMDGETLARAGQLATTGRVDWNVTVAVTGSCLSRPYVARTVAGCNISPLLDKAGLNPEAKKHHRRIISGNVLTGIKVDEDGYLHWPYRQITVIPEGDDVDQFMGWASLAPSNMSVSKSFPGAWLRRVFTPDARIRGGRRAMIMSGEYDKALPMDIMLEYLIKAINGNDIDNMERLGIYEIAPEDVALAEYADSSKLPLQAIVRRGLDLIRKEI